MNSDIEIGFRNTWAVENMCLQVQGPAHENDKALRALWRQQPMVGPNDGDGTMGPAVCWPQTSLCPDAWWAESKQWF